jgi:hypothetical protein
METAMRKHVKILGWLNIVAAVFYLLIGGAGLAFMTSMGLMSGEVGGAAAMTGIGGVFATIMLVIALPSLICGIGLLRNWGGWVIIFAVVLGVFHLPNFPLGTAIALYTFWIAWKLYDTTPDTDVK